MILTIDNCEEVISIDGFQESDYYVQIIEYFKRTQEDCSITISDIDIWRSKMFIRLIRDQKNKTTNKIKDIVKNSILLIMTLFKENENKDKSLYELPKDQKEMVISSLKCLI
jgi:hypothetical protein